MNPQLRLVLVHVRGHVACVASTFSKAAFCSYTHGSKSWMSEKSCMKRLFGSAVGSGRNHIVPAMKR
jgi:hypothetical protein